MKTEQEIRRHIANLRALNAQPCGCGATAHAGECRQAMVMIAFEAEILSWVLGENPSYQTTAVDSLQEQSKHFTGQG